MTYAAGQCIYLDPAKGYHLCRLPVAPDGVLLCPKHLALAKEQYRLEQENKRAEAEDAIREFHREDKP